MDVVLSYWMVALVARDSGAGKVVKLEPRW